MSQTTATATAAKSSRTRRQPIKALAHTVEQIAANAKADAERKAVSKARVKAAAKAKLEPETAKPEPETAKPETAEQIAAKAAAKAAADHEAYLAALRIDAAALGVDPDAYIAEQLQPVKVRYAGPMLALRRAAVGYVKAKNGQPCCGDTLAVLCGQYTREAVVAGLIAALKLDSNPYAHLNPGQQSMNLRNKARAALRDGFLQLADVATCLKAAS